MIDTTHISFFSIIVSLPIKQYFVNHTLLKLPLVCYLILFGLCLFMTCSATFSYYFYFFKIPLLELPTVVQNAILILIPTLCIIAFHDRLAELNYAVTQKMEPEIADDMLSQRPVIKEKSKYILAKSYFDVKEYSR